MHKVIHSSCLHFTEVDYYPALIVIMIWCDMLTSRLLSTIRVSSIFHGFCTACTISDVSQYIVETTINIFPIKCIAQYQSCKVTDFLYKEKKVSKAANIAFRFKRVYAWPHHHFADVCSNKTKNVVYCDSSCLPLLFFTLSLDISHWNIYNLCIKEKESE